MHGHITAASLLIAMLAGCNGMRSGADGPGTEEWDDDTAVTAGGAAPARDTAVSGGAEPVAQGAPSITPEMVALGDRVYHGRVAQAICYSCHGQDGKGTDTAPNLADNEWLNSDGSFNGIVQVVTAGVPNPKEHATAMPPMGGTRLSQEQIQAVSAYVYSLSHPEVGGR